MEKSPQIYRLGIAGVFGCGFPMAHHGDDLGAQITAFHLCSHVPKLISRTPRGVLQDIGLPIDHIPAVM